MLEAGETNLGCIQAKIRVTNDLDHIQDEPGCKEVSIVLEDPDWEEISMKFPKAFFDADLNYFMLIVDISRGFGALTAAG